MGDDRDRTAVAEVDGISLRYEVAGTGPKLLFIGGTGGDLRARPSVFDGPLGAHFELLAYDQRGMGRSDKPDVACSMGDYAADAAGLLDVVGWDRCNVMGVSFGGMVAQELAVRAPERVDRLVLACTSSGGTGGASYPLHELEGLEDEERLRRVLALGDRRFDAAWQEAHPTDAAAALDMMRRRSAVSADEPGIGAGTRRQLEARRHHDTSDRLGAVTAPTLVAAGRCDGIAPLANSEALVERIPDARLGVFEGGHHFLLQDPTAFEVITAFLLLLGEASSA